jgi:hypothetical protein
MLSARYVFASILSLALGVVACNPSDVDGDAAVAQPSVTVDGHEPSPRPRFVRLTHQQWELSIQENFALEEPTGLLQTFIKDGSQGGFSTDSRHLVVNPELWQDYQRAAEEIAQFVAREPSRLARFVDLDWFEVAGGEEAQCLTAESLEGLSSCCEGEGLCVPAAMMAPWLQDRMTHCAQGGLCSPRHVLDELRLYGTVSSSPCSSIGGAVGGCMHPCFPDVAAFASFMERDSCDEGLLCAPCIDPLSQEPSGVCGWEMLCPDSGLSLSSYSALRDELIAAIGLQLFRRPLAVDEVERYATAFELGVNTLGSEDFMSSGVEFTLRVMLQSPHFLYRIEGSRELGADGLIQLNGWEIAARLSLTLWNTTPSAAMLDAVRAGEFDTAEGVFAWTWAMVNDLRSVDAIVDFHRQLMRTSAYTNIQKQPARFPLFGADAGEHMSTEFDLFVADVLVTSRGGLSDLLTAPHTFVNQDLAGLYGLDSSAYGPSFQRVALDPEQRSGLLTRLGFLADRGTLTEPDPIRRGVLVAERIICAHLPPPPPNITSLPAQSAPTNRERVELHTGVGTCGEGCHSAMINPAGFPFETYDAVGQFRLEDNGYPVNAADVYILDGAERSYKDAIEFSQVLSDSRQVHACYAKHWLEYLYGREVSDADGELLDAVAEASVGGDLTVLDLVAAMLASDAFLKRSSTEMGPEVGR